MNNLIYKIALSLIAGIGNHSAKKLVAFCGGAEAVFKEKKAHLLKIPGIGEFGAKKILNSDALKLAEKELEFMAINGLEAHFYLDPSYPQRLLHCDDGPVILYSKGRAEFNQEKAISIVGTRHATIKGKQLCEKLVDDISKYNPCIISGLAYGIDIAAHKSALKNGLSTQAVLASKLSEIYPQAHGKVVRAMQEEGCILSDYSSNSNLIPGNFAERNRIVAGMCDALIVIESSEKGGSLITADLANGYNRDVFAFPGRPDDSQSVGCNRLIKNNKAGLIESGDDLAFIMGWKDGINEAPKQQNLFIELSIEEEILRDTLMNTAKLSLDQISLLAKMPMSQTNSILLSLEFKGLVRSLPGKMYELIN